jgi:hypothetical protein
MIMAEGFDIRDKIERFEELESNLENELDYDSAEKEFNTLSAFLDEVEGQGESHEWRGHWYPVTFVADDEFEDYARECAEDFNGIKSTQNWPYNCIDWEKAGAELKVDFTCVEYEGDTYWYR